MTAVSKGMKIVTRRAPVRSSAEDAVRMYTPSVTAVSPRSIIPSTTPADIPKNDPGIKALLTELAGLAEKLDTKESPPLISTKQAGQLALGVAKHLAVKSLASVPVVAAPIAVAGGATAVEAAVLGVSAKMTTDAAVTAGTAAMAVPWALTGPLIAMAAIDITDAAAKMEDFHQSEMEFFPSFTKALQQSGDQDVALLKARLAAPDTGGDSASDSFRAYKSGGLGKAFEKGFSGERWIDASTQRGIDKMIASGQITREQLDPMLTHDLVLFKDPGFINDLKPFSDKLNDYYTDKPWYDFSKVDPKKYFAMQESLSPLVRLQGSISDPRLNERGEVIPWAPADEGWYAPPEFPFAPDIGRNDKWGDPLLSEKGKKAYMDTLRPEYQTGLTDTQPATATVATPSQPPPSQARPSYEETVSNPAFEPGQGNEDYFPINAMGLIMPRHVNPL